MIRIIDFPEPLEITRLTWLSGPQSRHSGHTTAQDGSEQVFASIGSQVAFRLNFDLQRGRRARVERGFLTALHSGANWCRFNFYDPDIMMPAEAGINVAAHDDWHQIPDTPWGNGMQWSNGRGWKVTPPTVKVIADAQRDTGIIRLEDKFWGHSLSLGTYLGFFPFYFGLHMVTQIIQPGTYRIWPLLRKTISDQDFATLLPTIMMRTRPGGYQLDRGPVHTEGQSVELYEVHDYYVRELAEQTI